MLMAGTSGRGPVTIVIGFLGAVAMAYVLLHLPFLQTHCACQNRLRAMFDLAESRSQFRRAPIAYWFALAITLLFALPLYLLKIEPVIPPTSTKYFGKYNYEVYKNPKTRVVFDDARHYLLTTRDKYDIIASDPLDVFAKGTAAIYSKEYFENVKRHLNPGGMFTLYVPLYESDVRTVKSELATFFAAFPYSTIWANTINGQGYDMVFMGHLEPPKIDLDAIVDKLQRQDHNRRQPLRQQVHGAGEDRLLENQLVQAGVGR